jgi:hypothetical protein
MAMEQLEEPLLDRKVLPKQPTGQLEWGTERVLRQAYENCLRYRKLDLAIWDEAHHLRKVAGSRAFVEQMDTVKSIVNLAGTLHLLAGTYELLDLCDLSAELARRAYDVHLPRYGEGSLEQKIFANVVRSLQVHIPLKAQRDLGSPADYLTPSGSEIAVLRSSVFSDRNDKPSLCRGPLISIALPNGKTML